MKAADKHVFILAALLCACALARPAAAADAPKVLKPDQFCNSKGCHPDITEEKYIHGPINVGECKKCHKPQGDKHEFTTASTSTKMCTQCHEQLKMKKVVHKAFEEGGCIACHDPHQGESKMFLTASGSELCEDCHDELVEKAQEATTVHKAVLDEKRACLTCHNPHTSDYPKLLAAPVMDVCLNCHDKKIKTEYRTLPDLKSFLASKKFVHGPIKEGKCGDCHLVHGSAYFAMLKAEYPATFYAPFSPGIYALCWLCHKETRVEEQHTMKLTNFRNGDRNLHYLHVNKKIKGRTCRACHATHASNTALHIRKSVPFGSSGWAIPIRYTKTKNGGTCASGCHRPKTYDRENPVQYDTE